MPPLAGYASGCSIVPPLTETPEARVPQTSLFRMNRLRTNTQTGRSNRLDGGNRYLATRLFQGDAATASRPTHDEPRCWTAVEASPESEDDRAVGPLHIREVSNLIDFYKTQFRILWEWQGGPWALVKRLVITLVVSAIAFWVTAELLPNITVDRFLTGVTVVVVMALLNAVVRPMVLGFVAPRSLILTAISVLLLQILVFLIACNVVPGVTIGGFVPALFGSFVYAIINTALTGILGIDRGDSFYGSLIQRMLIKGSAPASDKPGLVIIQIDGLAHPILAGRMRAGSVNNLASWVRAGSHKLSRWEAILPSMTSASQAGILHGNNDGIPAFRWYERDRQKLMVSSSPVDAGEIVRRVSNGEGLLSNNGASITNLVTGDATRAYFTTAAIKDKEQGLGESKAFLGFFLSPSGYLRSFTLFLGEFFKERFQARRTRRSGIQPQMHRGMKYAGMRAASNVLLRDVNVSLIIEEMYRGANVIYADFTDYDELAHHCGPERVESFQALDGVDDAIGTLKKAAEDAPRPYRFIVLSDHGQSLGATFKQRYGQSLGEVVRDLMGGRATVVESQTAAEGSTFVNAFLSEITRSSGVGPSVARAALASKTTDGVVDLDAVDIPPPADESAIAVVGSGQPGPRVVHRERSPAHGRGDQRPTPAVAGQARSAPGCGAHAGPFRRAWRHGPRPRRGPVPRSGPRRRRRPDHAFRRAHGDEPQARGRDDPRARHPLPEPVRPGAR